MNREPFDPDRLQAHTADGNGALSPDVERTAHSVIGAAIEVHRELEPGYLESVYEEALSVELDLRSIPHVRQASIHISYKDQPVGEGRVDLLVDQCLIVELKAVDAFDRVHAAQVLSYLKAMGCRLGLLINFNVPVLKEGLRRIAL